MSDPAILARLPACLPPGSRPSRSAVVDRLYSLIVGGAEPEARVRRYHLLYGSSARLARTMDLDDVLETLESDLHFQVAANARRGLFVQAGVVGWRGQAIVIPGRSHSGKTSLVAALVRAGATYYSDEYAVFDRRGRVHPYPKPLSVREEAGVRAKKYAVETFGGRAGTKPLPVGLVLVTQYQPQARWRPRALSPGQGVLALLSNTVLARLQPSLAITSLHRAVLGAVALKGKRGEVENVIAPILKLLEGSLAA